MNVLYTTLLLTLYGYSFSVQHQDMKIKVSNIGQITGNLMIAMYDSKETFTTRDVVASAKVLVTDHTQEVYFKDIAFGEYAVIMYHDLNSNGKLETNFLGIPSEPFGFSNGSGFLGLPSYNKSKFFFDKDSGTVEIELD